MCKREDDAGETRSGEGREERREEGREEGKRRVASLVDALALVSSRVADRRRRLSELRPAGVFSLLLLGVVSGCVGVGAGRSSHILTPDPSAPCRERFLPLSSASMTSAVSGTCCARPVLSVSFLPPSSASMTSALSGTCCVRPVRWLQATAQCVRGHADLSNLGEPIERCLGLHL